MTSKPGRDPVRSDTDVLSLLGELLPPEDRELRSLWLLFCDAADIPLPIVTPIDDVPVTPDEDTLGGVLAFAATVLDEHAPKGSVIAALARPGRPGIGDADLTWAHSLHALFEDAGIAVRTVLVTPFAMVPIRGRAAA